MARRRAHIARLSPTFERHTTRSKGTVTNSSSRSSCISYAIACGNDQGQQEPSQTQRRTTVNPCTSLIWGNLQGHGYVVRPFLFVSSLLSSQSWSLTQSNAWVAICN